MLTLLDTLIRRHLVSVLVIFQRLRDHHKSLASIAMDPTAGLELMQLWAHEELEGTFPDLGPWAPAPDLGPGAR